MGSQQGKYATETEFVYEDEPRDFSWQDVEQVPELGTRSLLDSLLEQPVAKKSESQRSSFLDDFLKEQSSSQAIVNWLGKKTLEQKPSRRQIALWLNRDIAMLDSLLSEQVNAIIHHPKFQKLEASWRGLHFLVNQVEEGDNLIVRFLDATWRELSKDLDRSLEFDQSQLFQKVYSEEFGTPGGQPYGVLLADYDVQHRPTPDHPTDDIRTLELLCQVGAAAFAPVVASINPTFLSLDSFANLEQPIDLERTLAQTEYIKWKSLRDREDSRFLALTLPRTLMRLPYPDDGSRTDGFRFQEDVSEPDRSGYLWGNACYAFGSVLIRAFAESGWPAGIQGTARGDSSGGLVEGLASATFGTDKLGVCQKSSTDAILTDMQEKELTDLGLMPLCQLPDTELAAFYTTPSIQKPKKMDAIAATTNARISSMMQYILSVSRFAHYIKVIARDKIGAYLSPSDCEDYLNKWLMQYITSNDDASNETKAKFPLRESKVEIREHPGKPGSYVGIIHLRPHFQLDEVVTTIRLTTELNGPTA